MHIIKQEICKLIKSLGRHNTQNVKRRNHTRMNGTGMNRTGMIGTDLIGPLCADQGYAKPKNHYHINLHLAVSSLLIHCISGFLLLIVSSPG